MYTFLKLVLFLNCCYGRKEREMSEITELTEENKRKFFNNYTLSTHIVSYVG